MKTIPYTPLTREEIILLRSWAHTLAMWLRRQAAAHPRDHQSPPSH